jgi:YVTN family beta-propeller protein
MRTPQNLRLLVPAVALLASVPLQAQTLGDLAGPPCPDGDAVVLVLDGSDARRVVGGVEVEAQPLGAGPAASACGTVVDTLLEAGVLPEADIAAAAAFSPDGSLLVVAHMRTRNLVVFDAATQTVLRTIDVSGTPVDVAVSSDNVHAVTANLLEDTVSIVDLVTGTELATVPVGTQPAAVRVTPGGTTAVVGNAVDQSLSVVDIPSATELRQIAGTGFVSTTTISFEPGVITYRVNGFVCPSDTLAVHADFYADEIDFFDLAAGTVTSVPCAADPRGIDVTPAGNLAVVSHTGSARTISVVDPVAKTISKTIATPSDLNEPIAVRPDGSKAAVAIQNATLVVDLASGAVSSSLNTASVNRMLSTPDNSYVLAVGYRGALISYATQTVVKELNNQVNAYVGAMSPVGQRAVLVANHNAEDALFVNTNGASGFLEARVPTGPPPEADAVRDVAISADGSLAVTTNILSSNASVVDVASGTVLAIVPVGARPADVAITPDKTKAVVANLDSTFASVIDLTTYAVTNVTISTRGSEVEISPDGQYAYVGVVASGDGVWRIDLNTLTTSGGKLPTGNMGGIYYLFGQASGMTLSHDGATLAVCGTYDDTLTLVDTATWTVAANVPVGDYPVRATFAPDDSELYVALKTPATVAVVSNAGAASAVTGTIAVGQQPFEMAVSSDGGTLYVAQAQDDSVGVVDLASGLLTSSIAVPDSPQGLALSPSDSCLYVASGTWSVTLGPGPKVSFGQAGAVSVIDTATQAVVQSIDTGLPPGTLVLDPAGTTGLVPSPFADGLTRLDVPSGWATYCTSKVNSQGCAPPISAVGALSASAGSGFVILATQVIPNAKGLFFYSTTGPAAVPFQGGFLCVQSPVRRTFGVTATGSGTCGGTLAYDFNGYIALGLDPNLIAGNTIWGQFWSRDPASPSTTSLTDGLTATIAP